MQICTIDRLTGNDLGRLSEERLMVSVGQICTQPFEIVKQHDDTCVSKVSPPRITRCKTSTIVPSLIHAPGNFLSGVYFFHRWDGFLQSYQSILPFCSLCLGSLWLKLHEHCVHRVKGEEASGLWYHTHGCGK